MESAGSEENPGQRPQPAPLLSVPLPTGHPWDYPFFLVVSGLQYCRLAWVLCMAIALFGWFFLLIMFANAYRTGGLDDIIAFSLAPLVLLYLLVANPYELRQRQRTQLHRDLRLLAAEAGDHDLADQPSLARCSLRDRWRYRAALLQALRHAGHCRNAWDAFTYTCSLMTWYELSVPGLLAAWVLVSLTPEVLSGHVGWPFVDVAWWWWMQAAFAWRLKWSIGGELLAATVSAIATLFQLGPWFNAIKDLRATAHARKAKAAAGGGDTWMPPRPAHLIPWSDDPEDEIRDKDRRLMRIYMALQAPPSLYERIGVPLPSLGEALCLLAALYGAASCAALAELVAPRGTLAYTTLTWPAKLLKLLKQQLWSLHVGAWGLTGGALVVAWIVAAVLQRRYDKRWRRIYKEALARHMVASGVQHATRACQDVASSEAYAACGDYLTSMQYLTSWCFEGFCLYLALGTGTIIVSWLLYGGNLPAYALSSFRGYTGYSGYGLALVEPPRPYCVELIKHAVPVSGSGSGSGAAEDGVRYESKWFGGETYLITPELVTACAEVAGQDGGWVGRWRQLQMAARINLLAVRAFRSRGLDGVQAAMEALRAAWELQPFVVSGQAADNHHLIYNMSLRVLLTYSHNNSLSKTGGGRTTHAGVQWPIGISGLSLRFEYERISKTPQHLSPSTSEGALIASSTAAGAGASKSATAHATGGVDGMSGRLKKPMDLLIDPGHDAHAPPPELPHVCEGREVFHRALTAAWRCAAAHAPAQRELRSAGSRAATGSRSSGSGSGQRAAGGNTHTQANSASSGVKRRAPAAAPAGSAVGGWLAFSVALTVVYMWAFVWPPWTRSPELFVDHMAGLLTRGGREARTAARKAAGRTSAAAGSSGGSRRDDATSVAPSAKAQKPQQPQKQKQPQKQQPTKQSRKAANGAAAESAASYSGPTRTTPASPPAEPAEVERAGSSSSAQSAAAAAAAPVSFPVRSASQSSSKQGSKGKPKAQPKAAPDSATPAVVKPAAAPGPSAAAHGVSSAAAAGAAAAADKPAGAAPSLADLLPFTANLASNRPQQPDAESDLLSRMVDEAIAAQHAPQQPPPAPATAAPEPKWGDRSRAAAAAAGAGAAAGKDRSYASAAASHIKCSSAPKPAAAVPDAAGGGAAATPAAAAAPARPTVTHSGSLFSWNRPVIITSAPPPPLTAAQLRAQAEQGRVHAAAPAAAAAATAAAAPDAAGRFAAAAAAPASASTEAAASALCSAQPVGAPATSMETVPIPIPIPIPIPDPISCGPPASHLVSAAGPAVVPKTTASGAAGAAAVAAAAAAAAASTPLPRAPPSSFLGFNPALAHVLGRAYSPPAAPPAARPAAPAAASAAAQGNPAGPAESAGGAGRAFALYDTAGLDAAKCIRCRGGMREVVYLHKNNTVAHRAFCRACSAADGRAAGEPCPLCNQPVERVLSMF